MKKFFLLFLLCAVASAVPAQKKMYVWVNEVPTEFTVLDVDSVTFADALPEKPEPTPEPAPEPLSGIFSVSETTQIQFSRGNLQYTFPAEDGGEGTWSFAEQQYDCIGTDNVTGGTASSDATGDSKEGNALASTIDLFGWSSSTGSAAWGISTSKDDNDYSGEFKDWGQNIGDGWRTLTYDEWNYLLNTRDNASNLKGVARIDLDDEKYINGLVLLPDDWEASDEVAFQADFGSTSSVAAFGDVQTLTLSQWQALEKTGAVFLPAAGNRGGTKVNTVQRYGYYWSATPYNENNARILMFYSSKANANATGEHYIAFSVRLVQDVE